MQIMFPTLRKALGLFLAVGLVSSFAQADSTFRDMRGNITTFDAQQSPGQWTVVMIWASDCHVCNQESGQYSKFHTQHADRDANMIGISIDGQQGKKAAEAFIARNRVIFPNLIADVQFISRWYQMQTGESFRATPTFVVFDPQGEVRAAQPGAVPPKIIEDFIAANS
jgi:alkyl hydroperoxide reductase subunit AhpC